MRFELCMTFPKSFRNTATGRMHADSRSLNKVVISDLSGSTGTLCPGPRFRVKIIFSRSVACLGEVALRSLAQLGSAGFCVADCPPTHRTQSASCKHFHLPTHRLYGTGARIGLRFLYTHWVRPISGITLNAYHPYVDDLRTSSSHPRGVGPRHNRET